MKFQTVFGALLLVFAFYAHADRAKPLFEVLVEAIEIDKLDITLDGKLNGYVELGDKKCRVTSETKAFANDVPVALSEVKKQKGKPATVLCDVKTRHVPEITWVNK